jgi:hypothetical protein
MCCLVSRPIAIAEAEGVLVGLAVVAAEFVSSGDSADEDDCYVRLSFSDGSVLYADAPSVYVETAEQV